MVTCNDWDAPPECIEPPRGIGNGEKEVSNYFFTGGGGIRYLRNLRNFAILEICKFLRIFAIFFCKFLRREMSTLHLRILLLPVLYWVVASAAAMIVGQ